MSRPAPTRASPKVLLSSDADHLLRLVYVSTATRAFSSEEVAALAAQSAERNRRCGLTGALMYARPQFFQILEGRPRDLSELLDRLKRDPRHAQLAILDAQVIGRRAFANWNMEVIDLNRTDDQLMIAARSLFLALQRTESLLSRFAQPALMERLRQGLGIERPDVRTRTVMFVDLMGYTHLCDRLPFDRIAALMEAFFGHVGVTVREHGGEIAKLIGDAAMAWFPGDAAASAVAAAVELQRRLSAARAGSAPDGLEQCLHAGVGIATGEVLEGVIRCDYKLTYDVVGPTVNLASRIQSLTRTLGWSVAFDDAAARQVAASDAALPLVDLGEHALRGVGTPVVVHTVNVPELRGGGYALAREALLRTTGVTT